MRVVKLAFVSMSLPAVALSGQGCSLSPPLQRSWRFWRPSSTPREMLFSVLVLFSLGSVVRRVCVCVCVCVCQRVVRGVCVCVCVCVCVTQRVVRRALEDHSVGREEER